MPICSADSARLFSQKVSRMGPQISGCFPVTDTTSDGCNKVCQSNGSSKLTSCCKESNVQATKDEWTSTLCYGCRVTIQDVVSKAGFS